MASLTVVTFLWGLSLVPLVTCGDLNEVLLPHDHPAVSEVLRTWRHLLPLKDDVIFYPGHLLPSTKVDDPCSLTNEEDASLSTIRVFLESRRSGHRKAIVGNDHNQERLLGAAFLFFLRKTRHLRTPLKNGSSYCDDFDGSSVPQSEKTFSVDDTANAYALFYNFAPPPLVCFNGRCKRCDDSEVSGTEACRTLQEQPKLQLDSTEVLSHHKFPNWTEVMRMTPEDFVAAEKTSADLEEGHFFVGQLLDAWKSWAAQRSRLPAKICEVGDEEQLGVATVETLLKMDDAAGHLARNLGFFLRQTVKLREEDLALFCGDGQACLEGRCVPCGEVNWNTTNEEPREDPPLPSKLYLACHLEEPGKKGRFVLPAEMPPPATTEGAPKMTTHSGGRSLRNNCQLSLLILLTSLVPFVLTNKNSN